MEAKEGIKVKLGNTVVLIGGKGGREVIGIHFHSSSYNSSCGWEFEKNDYANFKVTFSDKTEASSDRYWAVDGKSADTRALEAMERFEKLIGWKDVCDEAHTF